MNLDQEEIKKWAHILDEAHSAYAKSPQSTLETLQGSEIDFLKMMGVLAALVSEEFQDEERDEPNRSLDSLEAAIFGRYVFLTGLKERH